MPPHRQQYQVNMTAYALDKRAYCKFSFAQRYMRKTQRNFTVELNKGCNSADKAKVRVQPRPAESIKRSQDRENEFMLLSKNRHY